MYRRKFLTSSGLLSLAPIVPEFVNSLAASTQPESDQKILVVIELNGGNDGINTVVPFQDDQYKKHRQKLQLEQSRLHSLNDTLGLHPSMRHCKLLFDDGEFGIVNGVGYPNPNRSHFESLDIWHRGLLESRRPSNQGWLGHALDRSRDPQGTDMDGYFIGRQSVSAALVNRRAQVAALSRFDELRLAKNIETTSFDGDASIEEFVRRQITSAYATSKQIESIAKSAPMGGFPSSQLGQQMRLISQLIKSGSAARVYYTLQTGYDTHSTQSNTHSNLLFNLSSSIKSFVDDLKQNNLDDRVVVMAFSEFGRRVQENASMGTDHGTAGPVFLAGTPIKAGVTGETTNLSDLVDGDIKTQFDFRQIYATILDRWLEIPSAEILGQTFEPLDLV